MTLVLRYAARSDRGLVRANNEDSVYAGARLLALAADSDILVVACRADASNRKAVDAEVIAAVGPRGLIVNVARGSIIDEDALIAALKDGRLGRAGQSQHPKNCPNQHGCQN